MLLLSGVVARLVILQVPVATAPVVDFEFGPLEPGSLTTQGLGDLGESVSGIALPAIAYGAGEEGVTVRFRIRAGDGAVVEEQVLAVLGPNQVKRPGDPETSGEGMRTVRLTFAPLAESVHAATLEIVPVDLGGARVFLGATKDDALPGVRLAYQGIEMFADQDLRVGQLRTLSVWRLLAELRRTGPTGFAAAAGMGGVVAVVVAVAIASRIRPPGEPHVALLRPGDEVARRRGQVSQSRGHD